MYTKQLNRQKRRVNRRLNKTGLALVIDIAKRKARWRSVSSLSGLSKEEKNTVVDIWYNETLRKKYLDKIITRTR